MKKNDCKIRLLKKDSIEEQILVFNATFQDGRQYDEIRSKWELKHYCNPLGESLVFGAYVGDKLVGVKCYYPAEYICQSQRFSILVSCDSAVLPQYQGNGIWNTLIKYAIDYIYKKTNYKTIISFPKPDTTYQGFKKMGWITINQMNNYIYINNSSNFSKILSKSVFLNAISFLFDLQKISVNLFDRLAKNYTVQECNPMDLLWAYDENSMHIHINENTLQWKIQLQDLKSIAVYQNNKIIATCLYSIRPFSRQQILKIYHIASTGVQNMDISILAKIITYLSKEYPECAYIRTWVAKESRMNKIYKKLLFLQFVQTNPFVINCKEDCEFPNVWDVSMFDLDY